jgi:hypothetical protein
MSTLEASINLHLVIMMEIIAAVYVIRVVFPHETLETHKISIFEECTGTRKKSSVGGDLINYFYNL